MKTKKEQIIEILGKIGRPISIDDVDSPTFWLEEAADAILALPLEVPKTKEINATANRLYKHAYNPDGCVEKAFKLGMKIAIDEIVKRNK